SDGQYNYGYDNEGNIISKTDVITNDITIYAYDHRNRMTAVVIEDSTATELSRVEYIYDVMDRRIGRLEGNEAIYTVYADKHAWLDFDELGNVKSRYLFGNKIDEILARYQPGEGTVWYLTDNLGSVRDVADINGNIKAHIDYDAFGNPVVNGSDPGIVDRFMFTGREYDTTTGLYYYRSRYYDPSIGRFLSEDRIGFGGRDVNLYRYVYNIPIKLTDPFGKGIAKLEYFGAVMLGTLLAVGWVDYVENKRRFKNDNTNWDLKPGGPLPGPGGGGNGFDFNYEKCVKNCVDFFKKISTPMVVPGFSICITGCVIVALKYK
ncbi:MAG: RHS repeat-associated core domain-containing protein, partial [candidate division Zixibacteria bacterium]|nr:RHS repeat-associated core domain-containing protein [candidate division Zixibacteria bacterium]